MRTNIVIDDALMKEAQAALGAKTKREVVQIALQRIVQEKRQEQLYKLRGLGWEGDLDAMRTD
ncbi:type II toxin-antitoxin system VapB family antitoxin [Sphingomonas koreensis]|nr:type II toxin-antitoxin system VapB family antitoxin [Sphingomonas koreensis]